jgi:hypothetical protein
VRAENPNQLDYSGICKEIKRTCVAKLDNVIRRGARPKYAKVDENVDPQFNLQQHYQQVATIDGSQCTVNNRKVRGQARVGPFHRSICQTSTTCNTYTTPLQAMRVSQPHFRSFFQALLVACDAGGHYTRLRL